VNHREPKEGALVKRVGAFWARCESWRTKRGSSCEKSWCLLGKIHGDGKHMSGESFVSNMGESCETKREDP